MIPMASQAGVRRGPTEPPRCPFNGVPATDLPGVAPGIAPGTNKEIIALYGKKRVLLSCKQK